MSSEASFWKEIKKNIGHRGHFSRVESPDISAGIPDVDYCIDGVKGHIELKYAEDGVPKLRPTQARWFRARAKAGEDAYLFAKIVIDGRPKWFLFRGDRVQTLADVKCFSDWEVNCNCAWYGIMNWQELVFILKGGNPSFADKGCNEENEPPPNVA